MYYFSLSYLVIHELSTILQTSSGDNFKKKIHDLNFSRKIGNNRIGELLLEER